ncbi:MAG: isopentenyl-diphosphate Delta-isomerase [Patescibacteria group bacterium]|nr:isopentenyl-diphosphate Delta-isomerase [Patescibacteria group bacterium]
MGEQVVLVNDLNEPIGTLEKSKVHTVNTPLHRGFSLFLFNEKGEVLLQQRAFHKKTWGGFWSNSCCGHPAINEKNADAALRRLSYELGIDNSKIYEVLPDYRYRFANNGIWENEICPVFAGFTKQEARPNKEEVEDIKRVDWNDFLKEINTNSESYSPWCVEETKLLSKDENFRAIYKKGIIGLQLG